MKKILFIVGSLNQTKQMFQISRELPDFEHYFTQVYGSGRIFKWIAESGLADFTTMGINSAFARDQREYLQQHHAKMDYRGSSLGNEYELVFNCVDLIMPKDIKHKKTIFIQEGMTDPLSWKSKLVKRIGLPAWFTGDTSLNGCSNNCDIYCVASKGYADFFASLGTDPRKIVVTGIPNFDNVQSFINNDFPYKNYVLVCTSDMREVGKIDLRMSFLNKCKRIANGRDIIFKLHPNEKPDRAISEIRKVFGHDVLVFTKGNTDHMIANCEELITQYSSVVYIGMALGKKVHSYFPMEMLRARMPLQNNGTSAKKIADIARGYIQYEGSSIDFLQSYLSEDQAHQKKFAVAV